jgi:hypothetical protein
MKDQQRPRDFVERDAGIWLSGQAAPTIPAMNDRPAWRNAKCRWSTSLTPAPVGSAHSKKRGNGHARCHSNQACPVRNSDMVPSVRLWSREVPRLVDSKRRRLAWIDTHDSPVGLRIAKRTVQAQTATTEMATDIPYSLPLPHRKIAHMQMCQLELANPFRCARRYFLWRVDLTLQRCGRFPSIERRSRPKG